MLHSAGDEEIDEAPPGTDESKQALITNGEASSPSDAKPSERNGLTTMLRAYARLLTHNAPFRIVWLATVVCELGDWADEIAVITILNRFYAEGSMLLSLLLIARELPPFLWGGPAGVVADKFDRRKIMLISDLLRMVIVLGFLLVQSKEHVPLLFVLSFLQFTVTAFFIPAKSALIPSYVEEKDVLYANSLDSLTWSTILFLGAGIGGLVTGVFGTNLAFVIDAGSYLLSAALTLLLWRYPFLEVPKKEASTEPKKDVEMSDAIKSGDTAKEGDQMTDGEADRVEVVAAMPDAGVLCTVWLSLVESFAMFRDGFVYLWRKRELFVIAHLKSLGTLVWGGQELLNLRYAGHRFALGEGGSLSMGMLYAVIGVSTGVGPAMVQAFLPDTLEGNEKGVLIGFMLLFIGSVILALSTNLWILLIANLIRPAGSGILWVFTATMMMKMSDAEFRGRVFAYEYAILTLAGVLSKLSVGFGLTMGLSLELLSGAAAGVAFLMLLCALFLLPTSQRWLLRRMSARTP